MPGRNVQDGRNYRYGFQGQETDPEWLDGAVSYKYRVHDARIGRFLSIDPLAPDYPANGPYNFAENRVTDRVELEGLEAAPSKEWEYAKNYLDIWYHTKHTNNIYKEEFVEVLYQQMSAIITQKSGVDQVHGTYYCGTACALEVLLEMDPVQFTEMVLAVFENGTYTNSHGITRSFKPDVKDEDKGEFKLKSNGSGQVEGTIINFAEYIAFGAMKNKETMGGFDPRYTSPGIEQGVFPGEFNDYIEELGFNVVSHTGYRGYENLTKLSKSINKGYYLAALIYPGELDKTKRDKKEYALESYQSYTGIHYVIFRSIIDNGDGTYNISYWEYGNAPGTAAQDLGSVSKQELQTAIKNTWIIKK